MIKIAINGFGRMGRLFFRQIWQSPDFTIVHINEPSGNAESAAHLLAFDSVHGRFMDDQISATDSHIQVAAQQIKFTQSCNINDPIWQDIDMLVDCSGQYRDSALFEQVYEQGVKKILVSCAVKSGEALNLVYGVNHHLYDPAQHRLITAASCTTNCLAPVVKVIKEQFGIKHAAMTTIHCATGTQNVIDASHKDLRRARATSMSLVPTTSNSTSAIMQIFPELSGKLNGLAVRVPLMNASITDVVFELDTPTTAEEVNRAFEHASKTDLQGILGYETRPLVSVDYCGDPHSGTVDALSTQVTEGTLLKVIAWYDNEINYVSRMKDIAHMIAASC